MTTEAMLYPHRPLPHGCECNVCTAEALRDNELRDKALAQVVFEAGIDQLRAAVLDRVPAFVGAFDRDG